MSFEIIQKAFEKRQLAHAFLFLGPPGSGQKKAALELSKLLFCENQKGSRSCGNCFQCAAVGKNAHPDLLVVSPEEDKNVIKIEKAREIIAQAALKPFQARAKVFVIDRAETLNEVAQNALLKTLEEPAPHTYFVLISPTKDGILETVRSRSQIVYFTPKESELSWDAATEELKRQALDFLLLGGTPPDLSKLERESVVKIFDFLVRYLREVLLLQAGAESLLALKEDSMRKRRLAEAWDVETLEAKLEALAEAVERVRGNLNLRLVLSHLWSALEGTHAV